MVAVLPDRLDSGLGMADGPAGGPDRINVSRPGGGEIDTLDDTQRRSDK